MSVRRSLSGWGRTAPTTAEVVPVVHPDAAARALRRAGTRGVVARGLGRSYGDAAQNAGGLVLDLTPLDRIHRVDAETRTVTVDAGVSLDTLMRVLLPFGLWVPVVPGTRQVTVGGAIAADVHGKNHHRSGSFGSWVESLTLLTADGERRALHPDGDTARLYWATVGGMGLTGVVLAATLRVQQVSTSYFVVDTERARDLDDLMARLTTGDDEAPYSVAWFDSIAGGRSLGRGVITRGRSATLEDLPAKLRPRARELAAPQLGVVPDVVADAVRQGVVNRVTGRVFNELWYRKAPRHRTGEVQDVTTFFHPLDVLGNWNRLYGARGLCQYQFVVPFGREEAVRRCTERIAGSGHVSCLNVLKRFGPGNASPLSFPRSGWTLAVDLPVRPGLDRLFADLDDLVLGAGGRVYLAKDSRLPARHLAAMYPRLEEFRAVRAEVDPRGVFRSDQSRRLGL